MKLKLIKELSSLSSNKQDHQGSGAHWMDNGTDPQIQPNIYHVENKYLKLFISAPDLISLLIGSVRRKLLVIKYLEIFPGLIFIREAKLLAIFFRIIIFYQERDSFVSFSYILLPLQSLCISQVLLENLSPFLSLPTSFSWIRKYLIKLFFNHLLKEYWNTQLLSDCFLPSLLLHSSLSVQFELDCLARKHRGIASKLGATAGTNNTGIKISLGVEVVGLIWQ